MKPPTKLAEVQNESLSRRRFLGRSAKVLSLAAAGTFLYTWRVEPHWVEIVERPMPIERLPSSMVGKRLVQVSDLHTGPIVDRQFLISSLEGIAELKPDAIVLTGDFMSCDGGEEVGEALDVLRAVPEAPLGRLAILGNHDYGQGWIHDDVANKLCDGLSRLDIRPLRNETANLGALQVAGMDDLWAGSHFQPERALRDLSGDGPALALCHNPDAVDLPQWGGFRGWILAGHTHGGQCKPPFLPPPLTPVKNKRYVAGAYDVGSGRQLYINRGLGYLMRVRFNARPEITVFTLQRA
jgi:predicted MPP superfamily phosphohydrolase